MRYSVALMAFLFSMLIFSSCKEEVDNNEINEITEIKYGTSFGECMGFCAHNITLTDGNSDSEHVYFGGASNQSCSKPYSHWATFTSAINFETFKQLETVIGCPDCADGGAEWIEITAAGETHKVTFEFHIEPVTTSAYIQELRDQLELMKAICL